MTRQKTPKTVITFPNTHAAMTFEEFATENNLPGRIIPVPSAISAGCGLSWCAPPEHRAALLEVIKTHALEIEGVHTVNLY